MNNVMFLDSQTIVRFADALTTSPGYTFFMVPNYKKAILAGKGVNFMNMRKNLNLAFTPSPDKVVLKRKSAQQIDDLRKDSSSIFAISKRMVGQEEEEEEEDVDMKDVTDSSEILEENFGEASGVIEDDDRLNVPPSYTASENTPQPYNTTPISVPLPQDDLNTPPHLEYFEKEDGTYRKILETIIQTFESNQKARGFTGDIFKHSAFKLPASSDYVTDIPFNTILYTLNSVYTDSPPSERLPVSEETTKNLNIIYDAFVNDQIDFFGSNKNFGADLIQYANNNYIIRSVNNDIIFYYIPPTEISKTSKVSFNQRAFSARKNNPSNFNLFDVNNIQTKEQYTAYTNMIKQNKWHY